MVLPPKRARPIKVRPFPGGVPNLKLIAAAVKTGSSVGWAQVRNALLTRTPFLPNRLRELGAHRFLGS
jgi:hypothetical protein